MHELNTASAAKWSNVQKHFEAGELFEASTFIADWLTTAPADANAATAQAQLLRLCGQYQHAQAALDRAFVAAPEHGPACLEAARLAAQLGELERGLHCFERAHRAMPDATRWLGEWTALAHRAQPESAVEVAKRWCEAAPEAAEAWFALGLAHQQANAFDASLDAYQQALALNPDLPMLRNNLVALHYSRGENEAALRIGMEALRAEPDHALAWTNLANVSLKLHEPAKALIAARRAVTLAPDYSLALLALSNAARESQLWDEAFEAAVRAAKAPGVDPQVQFSVAMLQLMRGDYRNGWINFEARWSGSPELKSVAPFCPERRWRGEALAGKTLLVWGEQGFGDAIQFIRFLPLMAERARAAGGTVICCCFPPLYELFKRSLGECDIEVLHSDTPRLPPFDYQIPLGSLPLALEVTLESLHAPPSYLRADARRVSRWRDQMGSNAPIQVGLVWTGSRGHQRNALRAIAPESYAQTFAGIDGVEFHNLQPGAADDLAIMATHGLHVIDRSGEWQNFDDTAALVCSLDLVVTVCTSVAHLAGALRVPTWLLLDVNPHWLWMLERDDSPWYPSMQIYRQAQYREWLPVLGRVKADLVAMTERRLAAD
ncbi:tetratricopeptide repeat protein [Paraburkholderia rhynchosiae]|uniref:Beta-barrel assembly-enhancing protease n=1 Tax=Paraburkholderia rhynchosiae TaxID=487049 RepID=A0A2N7WJ29_9BURK|nr:tetratricopeptide repeat protein [Paraburkholderia rhynchosiae]PMS29466.1 hypothetical protein C0Z16_17970 [Paraburkholderia rhynchosiae]CAB3705280.1 Beta-barrel assembly-enhancing protease [Paraburkholderia rhynchosiae]